VGVLSYRGSARGRGGAMCILRRFYLYTLFRFVRWVDITTVYFKYGTTLLMVVV